MPDDIRPASQNPRAQAALTGGPTVEDAFLILNAGGDWEPSATGPAEGFWEDNGSNGYEPSASAIAHDAYFKRIAGDYVVQ